MAVTICCPCWNLEMHSSVRTSLTLTFHRLVCKVHRFYLELTFHQVQRIVTPLHFSDPRYVDFVTLWSTLWPWLLTFYLCQLSTCSTSKVQRCYQVSSWYDGDLLFTSHSSFYASALWDLWSFDDCELQYYAKDVRQLHTLTSFCFPVTRPGDCNLHTNSGRDK